MQKRLKGFFALIIFLIILAAGRVFYIQFLDSKNLVQLASNQRILDTRVGKLRGEILDRNGIPFTDRSQKYIAVLEPIYLREDKEALSNICSMLELDYSKVKAEINKKKQPLIFDVDNEIKKRILRLKIKGISVLNSLARYDNSSLAPHITGYLSKTDSEGVSGIEKSYEDVLESNKETSVGLVKDAKNNPLQGLGYRIINNQNTDKQNVKLTLDYHIQQIAENVMDKYYQSSSTGGAIVIEDVNSGDIVASVSKPDFDQNQVENYLMSPNNELFNKAFAAYNLGSIFKIVDAAQALESGISLDESYVCNGVVKIGDRNFRCTSYMQGGHGMINFRQAFALSCNPYFIDLGIRIGHKDLLEMAQKFGLGSYTGIKYQGVNETTGNLPLNKSYFTQGDTANISIGQGDIMATPVQVTNLVATVANGGIKNRVNIVDSIVDSNGTDIKALRKSQGVRVISKETSNAIRSLMEAVIIEGTGKKVELEQYGGAGGKTASAETGLYRDGKKVVQAWFTGYFPKVNPKYAMTVFVENGMTGGQAAAPIFAEIAQEIMKRGL
ncbi:MAG TPA: penicillin-binding protein 2 [Clostridia bacterium]|nr:penicillin-binding protein 2 [Clostridia bacterium]